MAASTNGTGHASLGGDWTLELQTGVIDTAVVITPQSQADWHDLLSSVVTAFTPRFSANDFGDIAIIANTVMTVNNASVQNGTAANLNNNSYSMVNVDIDADATTFNSSSANLTLPSGSTVLFAGLYWAGSSTSAARNQVKLDTPSPGAYATITPASAAR